MAAGNIELTDIMSEDELTGCSETNRSESNLTLNQIELNHFLLRQIAHHYYIHHHFIGTVDSGRISYLKTLKLEDS